MHPFIKVYVKLDQAPVHYSLLLCTLLTRSRACDLLVNMKRRDIWSMQTALIGADVRGGKCSYAGVSLVAQDAILECQSKITETSRSCLSKGKCPHQHTISALKQDTTWSIACLARTPFFLSFTNIRQDVLSLLWRGTSFSAFPSSWSLK